MIRSLLCALGGLAAGAYATVAFAQWQQLGPPGGYVSDIVAEGNRLFAFAANNRLFRSDDRGSNWVELSVPQPCSANVFPLRSLQIRANGDLFLHCETIMRSRDGGSTWSAFGPFLLQGPVALHPTVDGRAAMMGLDYTPYVAATFNGGVTWTYQYAEPGDLMPSLIAYDREGGDRMIGVGTNVLTSRGSDGIINQYPSQSFESLDNGRTWRVSGTLVPASQNAVCFEQQFESDGVGRQYVLSPCALFRSQDGRNWERLQAYPVGSTGRVAVDPLVPGRLYAYDFEALFESQDAGSSWRPLAPPKGGLFRLAFGSEGSLWAATSDGVFVRQSGATEWIPRGHGLNAFPVKTVEPSAGGTVLTAIASTTPTPDRNLQSTDGGATWTRFAPAGESIVTLARNVSDSSSILAFSVSGRFYHSGDEGRTWQLAAPAPAPPAGTKIARAAPVGPQPGVVWALYTICVSNGFLGCFDRAQGVIRSSDGGRTWPNVSPLESSSFARVSPGVDPNVAMAAMESAVYVTRDAGTTWQRRLEVPSARPVFDPAEPGRWYAYGPGRGLHTTADGGTSWTRVAEPPSAPSGYDLIVDAYRRRLIAVGTQADVSVSDDRGATWRRVVEPSRLLRLTPDSARLGPEPTTTLYAAGLQGVLKLVLPESPSGTVRAVEYWNAAVDHYFITASGNEIELLDDGHFSGWARTGEFFDVYPPAADATAGTSPVCRYYGRFAGGLDSHFYSASPVECQAVGDRYSDTWKLESPQVFFVRLPDPDSGNCPAGSKPVYRLFNSRIDVNHRYVVATTLLETMRQRGWVPEGYGELGVAMCSPQ